MNQTTQSLLQEMAATGQAVIVTSRSRDLSAARDLLRAGICYVSSSKDDFFVIKFGTQPVTI
jgi:hypothetical protein